MSPPEKNASGLMDLPEAARSILDQWAGSLAQVIESMTDQRPQIAWNPGSGTLPGTTAAGEPLLWWEQPLRGGRDLTVWVGAPRAVWEHAGTLTLKAAGLETVAETEAKNTWFEILGQSLGAMARSIGAELGREIGCDAGSERVPDANLVNWVTVTMTFADAEPPPCLLVLAPPLLSALANQEPAGQEPGESNDEDGARPEPAASRTMELLLDVDLPVSISFGKTELPLKDVLKLMTGSIVELNRGVNEQVDVFVNRCLVARGEVVVVEGNYGVRIQEIASRHDRLRSLR
ncbi:MAG TPA: flagellar motor switch protein FliN [Bryobacteraceae bacterium]|jgi:flagellar motor switch protein FliN/FliY|nr:flagellar motor switch protein FliN [Bryobacteraceae bacterium]